MEKPEKIMAFTKAQIIDAIAEKTSVDKKVAEAMLDCLAQLAYEHAKDEFTLPGIGKLVVIDRKARIGNWNITVYQALDYPAFGIRINGPENLRWEWSVYENEQSPEIVRERVAQGL